MQQTIAVIGAGLMGHGIAQAFAARGRSVRIYDPSEAALDTVRGRIRANLRELGEDEAAADAVEPCSSLAATVADAGFIVEAAFENLAAKQALFATIEDHARPDAILASNTSVIPITAIMQGLRDRTRCLGTHWWNPPFLIPLVEIIGTEWTSPATIETTMALHTAIGKTAIHVKRDVPGFIGNRLQHALWREAISLVERGICDARDVDAVVKASFGRRLAVLGPLENADLIGTDLTLAVHDIVFADIEASSKASPYLEQLVADGHIGVKTGQGFRSWTLDETARLRSDLNRHLRTARDADNPEK